MPSRENTSQRADERGAASRLAPLDPVLLLNEGNRLCAQERFEEAIAVYGTALSLSSAGAPVRAMLLSNRAMARLEMQQTQAAMDDFDAALAVLASLPMGQDDAVLLEDIHRVALAGKTQAQARRQGFLT
jgi:Tfp pilus assembly protein PilF